MDIYKLKNMPEEDRQLVFESEAIKREEEVYQKPLTPEELTARKDSLVQLEIQKRKLEENFKEQKALHKAAITPIKETLEVVLDEVTHQSQQVEGLVYYIGDEENKMVHRVDVKGNVLGSRAMLPEERQHRLPGLNAKIS